MRSLALCIISLTITPVASAIACDDGHWVNHVSGDGRIVILEDRSVWTVDDGDEVHTALWLPATDIIACSDKLINSEDGEVASAHRIR
jgi:hypothetical protein